MKITGNKWGKYGCKFSIYKNIFSTIFFANFGANQNSNWVRLPKIELGQVRLGSQKIVKTNGMKARMQKIVKTNGMKARMQKNRKNERDESKNAKKS